MAQGAKQEIEKRISPTTTLPRWIISLFVAWQLVMVGMWLMPSSTLHQGMIKILRGYIWMTACWQSWQMFAPDPSDQDVYMEANIRFQDGTVKTWVFPRMAKQGFLRRYQDERFRKMIENAHQDSENSMWPYVARFAAIANNPHPKTDPVVHVDLVRVWQNIPPYGGRPDPYRSDTFYAVDYPPGALPEK